MEKNKMDSVHNNENHDKLSKLKEIYQVIKFRFILIFKTEFNF